MNRNEAAGHSLDHRAHVPELRGLGVTGLKGFVVAVSLLVGEPANAQPGCPCEPIPALAASRQFSNPQSGDRFNLTILPDGDFRCWGSNCPSRFAGVHARVVAVAAGYNHALTLHADGTVRQYVGGGSGVPPVPAAASGNVMGVAAGAEHSMALRQDGTVIVWAPVGNDNLTVPITAQSNVMAIAAGNGYSLALTNGGQVIQWGWPFPVPAEAQSDVIAIAGGMSHSLALKRNGQVIQWGGLPEPVPATAQADVVAIAAGLNHSLALRSNGTVVAWGKTLSAGCSGGTTAANCEEEPAQGYPPGAQIIVNDGTVFSLASSRPWCNLGPGAASKVRSIAAGGYRSLALLNDGTVVGWGDPVRYPLPAPPGGERSDPPVPSGLVGPHCITPTIADGGIGTLVLVILGLVILGVGILKWSKGD